MEKIGQPIGIGELSRQTGCHIETIRYYEKIGILLKPDRSPGGNRVYDQEHVKRLAMVMRCRQLGFVIDEIRTLLSLVDGGVATCAEVKSITEDHLKDVQQKIADLRKLETVLKKMVAECSGTQVPDCPIIDTLYAA